MTAIENYLIYRLRTLVDEANQVFYHGGPGAFPGYAQRGTPTAEVMDKLSEMGNILEAIYNDKSS